MAINQAPIENLSALSPHIGALAATRFYGAVIDGMRAEFETRWHHT